MRDSDPMRNFTMRTWCWLRRCRRSEQLVDPRREARWHGRRLIRRRERARPGGDGKCTHEAADRARRLQLRQQLLGHWAAVCRQARLTLSRACIRYETDSLMHSDCPPTSSASEHM